jgi:nickel/cobalt exporter
MAQYEAQMAAQFAFLLGALHALEPGHGKTALLAYAVGAKNTPWIPLVIGWATACAHTLSIVVIAALTHLLTHWLFGSAAQTDQVVRCLTWLSGLSIVMVGVFLLYAAIRRLPRMHAGCCAQHHTHASPPAYHTPVTHANVKISAFLGLGAGLIPCPSAMAAYLSSLASGSWENGLLIVGLFGLGIAASLSLVGCLCLFGAGKMFAAAHTQRWVKQWPVLQAIIIIGVGVCYLLR